MNFNFKPATIQSVTNDFLIIKNKKTEETSLSYVNSAYELTDHDRNNNFSDVNLTEDNRKLSLPNIENKNTTKSYMIRSLFRLSNITDMIRSLLKRRDENAHILLYAVVYMLVKIV